MSKKNKRVITLLSVLAVSVFLFCSCSSSQPKQVKLDYHDYTHISIFYTYSENVYTGTLLGIEIYDEGINETGEIYKIKVKVDEVIKGSFKEGEIVEDYCLAHFFDLKYRYLFMTGADMECGYAEYIFDEADNVYSAKVLEKEIIEPKENDDYVLYKFKAEVTEVIKGDYKVGDIVEDITSGRLQDIRDDVLFMTSDDDYSLGKDRLIASRNFIYDKFQNIYSMVKLSGNNKIQYGDAYLTESRLSKHKTLSKTEDELINTVRLLAEEETLFFHPDTFFPTIPAIEDIKSKYGESHSSYPLSEIEEIMKIIKNVYGEDTRISELMLQKELDFDEELIEYYKNAIKEKNESLQS